MARSTRAALIGLFALGAVGCPGPPLGRFEHVDLSEGAAPPPARIAIGRHVVARLGRESGAGPGPSARLWLDLFPSTARLLGAWVQVTSRGETLEGPARIVREARPGLTAYYLDWKAAAETSGVTTPNARDGAKVWLGPVCVDDGCETLLLGDDFWRAPGPD